MNLAEAIRQRLQALEPVSLQLTDESEQHHGHSGWREGGGTHWRVAIVSARFTGRSPVARHRMVYEAIGELMQNPIHALAITASTPEEAKGSK